MFWTITGLILLLILGFVMLSKGSDWLVDGSASIAKKLKIPQLIIGLTIVAMGTSAPEASVSISSVISGSSDISVGNIVGANLFTVLVVLGVSACIRGLPVKKSTLIVDIPLVLLSNALLILFGLDGSIVWYEGLIFFISFVAYIVFLILSAMKQRKKLGESLEETPEEEIKEYSILKSIILTILGLGVVVGGSSVAVYSAKELARIIGLTERIIALTVVSFGTALPEMFTSVKASIKGNVDIAVGNILGSNIFNLLFILGITSIISPIAFSTDFFIDVGVAVATMILLLALIIRKKRLNRAGGIVALSTYAIYFIYLLLAI